MPAVFGRDRSLDSIKRFDMGLRQGIAGTGQRMERLHKTGRRSPADVFRRRLHWNGEGLSERNLARRNARSEHSQIFRKSRRRLPPEARRRCFIGARCPDASFVARRFLDLGAHHVQVIRRRDYREQNDQRAGQCHGNLQGPELLSLVGSTRSLPQPIGRQRQQQPRKVQKQFHERIREGKTLPPWGVVCQKARFQVNVTSVKNRRDIARIKPVRRG